MPQICDKAATCYLIFKIANKSNYQIWHLDDQILVIPDGMKHQMKHQ